MTLQEDYNRRECTARIMVGGVKVWCELNQGIHLAEHRMHENVWGEEGDAVTVTYTWVGEYVPPGPDFPERDG